jgi:hypothetical protein
MTAVLGTVETTLALTKHFGLLGSLSQYIMASDPFSFDCPSYICIFMESGSKFFHGFFGLAQQLKIMSNKNKPKY